MPWSRIDPEAMKAVNLPFFKTRLNELSKELYLEHGWPLPDGHKENGWKNPLNFTLAEWQQAKRLDLDPREVKQVFQQAWKQADGLPAFRNALEEKGYYVAQGDRRGHVAVGINGEVLSVARWTGEKARDVRERLGEPGLLPSVDKVQDAVRDRMSKQLKSFIAEDTRNKREELKPLAEERRQLVKEQRQERVQLEQSQSRRWERETQERADRLRSGYFGKAVDILSGRYFSVRRQNERETFECGLRDRSQREALVAAQMDDRKGLQKRIDRVIARQRVERTVMVERIAMVWQQTAPVAQEQPPKRRRNRTHEHDLDL